MRTGSQDEPLVLDGSSQFRPHYQNEGSRMKRQATTSYTLIRRSTNHPGCSDYQAPNKETYQALKPNYLGNNNKQGLSLSQAGDGTTNRITYRKYHELIQTPAHLLPNNSPPHFQTADPILVPPTQISGPDKLSQD